MEQVTSHLQVLYVEDSSLDFELVRATLDIAGFNLEMVRADKKEELEAQLKKHSFDLILSDFKLIGLDGFQVLQMCRELAPDVPFICISGYIGEETAIELLREGAVDYVLKDRLVRLPLAINRAISEAREKLIRKKAEEALQQSEERLRDIIFSMADWVWEVDENGKYTYSSLKGPEFLGTSHEEILGKTPFDFMTAGEARKIAAIFNEIVSYRAPIRNLENWNIGKNGNEICLLTNGVPIIDKEGNFKGYRGVDIDITERKRAEQELIKAKEKAEAGDKLKSAFINNISHEVRTPLNGIVGFSEILMNQDLSPENKSRFNAIIKKSSARLIKTITSYMDISLIMSDNFDVFPKPLELLSLLKELKEEFAEDCNEKGVSFILDLPESMNEFSLISDPEILHKILSHLLDNAVKFTNSGEIRYGFVQKNGMLEFFVRDTGIGISSEKAKLIFDNFVQADTSMTRGYEGSGLGLSISKGLVNLLKGEIKMKSVPGIGSTFFFTIPQSGLNTYVRNKEYELHQYKNSPVILVAEDDDFNYQMIEIVLNREGFKVIRAENGLVAINECKTNPEISLVLMDLKMPVLGGLEATKEIRTFLPELPIVAITAYVSNNDENEAIKCGCDDFITKPLNRVKLLRIINRILGIETKVQKY